MGGRSYNVDMFPELTGKDRLRARAAQIMVALDCAHGKHRTETDADTGDEVCRYCGKVVERP